MPAQVIRPFRRSAGFSFVAVGIVVALMTVFLVAPPSANAAAAPVNLGVAAGFGVLGATTVTNAGATVVSTDVGVSPGTAVTGFPPGTVGGTLHPGDAVASQAHTDMTIASDDAAARVPDFVLTGDIGGTTLTPGVYNATLSLGITGALTLDGRGDPNAVFIIQTGSTLITQPASIVNLINGVQACNVFWLVGSSATLGVASTFSGTVLAFTSITVSAGASITGRALARNGAVTLDTNTVNAADCVPGTLSISVPDARDLGAGAPGTTITNTLGNVTVDDQRSAGPSEWTASVAATDFTSPGAPQIPASAVTYTPGTEVSHIGNGTFAPGSAGPLSPTPAPAYSCTGGTGTSQLVWNPTLAVAVPSTAIAAVYSGTVIHSVA